MDVEYAVIGGGPAGLQIGAELQRRGHEYVLLERGDAPGQFFTRFPRHRTLISVNKVHTGFHDRETNLRWDWNSLLPGPNGFLAFSDYSTSYFPSADSLLRYLADYAARQELNVRFGCDVSAVSRTAAGQFLLQMRSGGRCRAARLIVATGVTQPYLPDVPGIDLVPHYATVSVAPEEFVNDTVLILGKGNSAFETADNLRETAAVIHLVSPNTVTMAWKTHYVGNVRAINANMMDSYQLKLQNALLDADVLGIARRSDGGFAVELAYRHAHGEVETRHYDKVIACTGMRFDARMFDEEVRPALCIFDRFPAQRSDWESTNVEGLYFAGTLTQVRDHRRSNSAFIHGFRYNAECLTRILDQRYHGRPMPARELPMTAEALTEAAIARLNRSSALWQQFGFLADAIVGAPSGATAAYVEQLPADYIADCELGSGLHWTVTLEFGKNHVDDPFCIERHPTPEAAGASHFLHPVVRAYRGERPLGEHHVIEELNARWEQQDRHVRPLHEFFRRTLEAGVGAGAGGA